MERAVTVLQTASVDSPVGRVRLFAKDGALRFVAFGDEFEWTARALARRYGDFQEDEQPGLGGIATRLEDYFGGDLHALDTIPARPEGTAFQLRVWAALREIPVGTTVAYSELARQLGDVRSVRAVGAANGSNPVGIVIPCHRVIGADGSLVGYGGGLDRKRWLLAHEGALPLGRRPSARQLRLHA
jgi:methylated-DNA-[protein]-cysteine S-methyltransferase